MSTKIDQTLVRHISDLARLNLSDDEARQLGAQLSDIIAYIEKLNEVPIDGVEPTAHPLSICNVFRDDVPRPSLGVERVLANAPDSSPPYFKVPKVLE